jgi:hypothetical protein
MESKHLNVTLVTSGGFEIAAVSLSETEEHFVRQGNSMPGTSAVNRKPYMAADFALDYFSS